ncbi:nuclear transcription factor Y subunit B-3-like [Macadamia integrifolia]|uniref:nuclear transcription factor Y subunit B-3-like n=1 Tax=Macadamia integrifolia TaxID=60698 RepID=UPI001C4F7FCB|nr:nuclear transcription factor Y subunit B-3-like [Macadamia integrifolia]
MADETITDSFKEQDWFLPLANVSRIMKKSLPKTTKISKAKEIVQECVSEFISFITDEASDKCLREKKKTINGHDLLWAMTTLGFENYVRSLKVVLTSAEVETQGQGETDIMARQGFNNGFYSVDAQVVPKNFRDERKGHQPWNKELENGWFLNG